MKIVVCIKQVPNTSEVKINPDGTLKRDGVPSIMNPDDKGGLEMALQLKDQYGAHVTVITMGPPQADAILREAYAMGADEAILLTGREFGGADTLATSHTIAAALKNLEYDLIIAGRQAIDGDTAQVGAELSEYLGIPNVSNVLSVDEVRDGKAYLTASLDDRIVKLNVKLPCLISVDGDINTPRLPSYKVRKTIGDDKVKFLTFEDFDDQNPDNYGLSGSATQVERIFPPEKNSEKQNIIGNATEQTEQLFGILSAKKMI